MREPAADHLPNAFGDADLVDAEVARPAAVTEHERARLHEMAKYFSDEERVALGLGPDDARELEAVLLE